MEEGRPFKTEVVGSSPTAPTNDWEWVDEDGTTLIPAGYEAFTLTMFRWVPRKQVPYKANKRRYGR